jgi:hypothetical protein
MQHLPPQPLLSSMEEFDVHPLYDHAQMLGQAMIHRDRIELIVVALIGGSAALLAPYSDTNG